MRKGRRPSKDVEDRKFCNCAGCGAELLGKDEPKWTTDEERVAGRMRGRPYCHVCLTMYEGGSRYHVGGGSFGPLDEIGRVEASGGSLRFV